MILEGNQRGGAKNLALHLLKDENDHVTLHDLRGFIADDLASALHESYAISRGTRAKKFLFSLSLNPPLTENVSTSDFEDAIKRVEEKLGLSGQPRAIVFHEKKARRHAHVVWSRIDTQAMKAIPLPFTKLKLMEISRDLYLKHGWEMPAGFIRGGQRDPNNFTLAQWQQAKRIGKDPKAIKATVRDCWATSDTQASFGQALKEQGYVLAKGSRRAFVVVDQQCEIYSVPRWLGLRVKEVRTKLTDQEALPDVEKAKAQIAEHIISRLSNLQKTHETAINTRLTAIENELIILKKKQISKREKLSKHQEHRSTTETKTRQTRYNKGLRGFLDRFTGRHRRIAEQNKQETNLAQTRDQKEKDTLIFEQINQSKKLRTRMQRLEDFSQKKEGSISADLDQYQEIKYGRQGSFEYTQHPSQKGLSFER